MIVNTAASTGGALTVLADFHAELAARNRGTQYLVQSVPEFAPSDSITTLRFSWTKRHWLLRILFDLVIAPYLVRRRDVSTVISLQNLMVPFVGRKRRKVLLLHTPVPFGETQFSLVGETKLWIYRRMVSPLVLWSVRASDVVVVQTEWMKRAVVQRARVAPQKVVVLPPPTPDVGSVRFVESARSLSTFFYPASAVGYKNHAVIIEAAEILKQGGAEFKLLLTLAGTEPAFAPTLFSRGKKSDLPIEFSGYLSRDEVFETMASSVILFPSLLETYGLPLQEARSLGAPVIAADLPYAREVLREYDRVTFVDPHDARQWAAAMGEWLDRGGRLGD